MSYKVEKWLKVFNKDSGLTGVGYGSDLQQFIADLDRIAELGTKMTEYDKLGRLIKSRKEKEKLISKVADKKKNIRAKRKSRKVTPKNG